MGTEVVQYSVDTIHVAVTELKGYIFRSELSTHAHTHDHTRPAAQQHIHSICVRTRWNIGRSHFLMFACNVCVCLCSLYAQHSQQPFSSARNCVRSANVCVRCCCTHMHLQTYHAHIPPTCCCAALLHRPRTSTESNHSRCTQIRYHTVLVSITPRKTHSKILINPMRCGDENVIRYTILCIRLSL